MRFHDAHHHVHTLTLKAMGLLQHFVSLADSRREAKVHLQPASLLLADEG
jgi:hypothetical protein